LDLAGKYFWILGKVVKLFYGIKNNQRNRKLGINKSLFLYVTDM